MYFVAYLLDRHSRRNKEIPPVDLRGYKTSTWAPPDYQSRGIALPVNRIAYSLCPTFRDLYFEHVKRIPRPLTWSRVAGKAVHTLYKELHKAARDYCHATSAAAFDLIDHLGREEPALVDRVLLNELREIDQVEPRPPTERDKERLRIDLHKIVRFEARLIGSTIEREISRLPDRRPGQLFDYYFDFNVEFSVDSRRHGFTSPATPDFFYHQAVLGDIKVGQWQTYYDYTMVAYALAYEEEHETDIDLGAILLVECLRSRPVPSHKGSHIEILDDHRRRRFLVVRDRKLEIIAEQMDPGPAEHQEDCDRHCPYWDHCWGTTSNG
jgi:CRISPR-associated protein Cas4/Csa1 subtype I-A